jgi:hypothetical protein
MIGRHYLEDARLQLRKYRDLADRALAQCPREHWFSAPDPETNCIAVIVKHMAGNMRSRWTDFLHTDGEKPDRDRDREFVLAEADTEEEILQQWNDGWARTFAAIESLGAGDLERVVTIRGEPHTVLQAINRQLTHYAYHVGQLVLLARHYAGGTWRSLSIPRGQSHDVEVDRRGQPHRA